jgi:DNA-binding transcriptional LysR family regulator
MSRAIDLNDVRLLMQIVEHGSYTAAARATGVPKSTISQRIAALERTVGTGLLRRTSRSFSLTQAGAQLLPHARAIEELAKQIDHCLMDRGEELRGSLRVSCSVALAQFGLSPIVPKFLAMHARTAIRIEASNRPVDLVGEGFDMTIRGPTKQLKDSTLRQRVVARAPWVLAASPIWVAEHGMPAHPHEIPASDTLCFSTAAQCQDWVLRSEGQEVCVPIAPRLVSDDMAMLLASTVAGGGITSLPAYVLRRALHAGRLVEMLPDWTHLTSMITILTPPREQSSRLASTFSEFLAAELRRVVQAG